MKSKILLLTFFVFILVFAIFFLHANTKKYFDLKNKNTIYEIVKFSKYFAIKTLSKPCMTIIISQSPKDLNQFLNKKVHLTGKFIHTTGDKIICTGSDCYNPSFKLQAIEIDFIQSLE